ncbi:reverse transcriptase domain-containing protein [Tanacetum coccineum]
MTNHRNEISNFEQKFDESFHEAWDRYKDLLHACSHHGFTELHQLDTFYNALNLTGQDSLNSAVGGNLLERSTRDVLTVIKNKSKPTKLTHVVNQQTSVVTTAMTAILKQFQATPPPASVKAVEEICVTCSGSHPYYQCPFRRMATLSAYFQQPAVKLTIRAIIPVIGLRETLTDPELAEYTIKVPPPLVQKAKPTSLKNYVVHQRDPRHPHIPYPSRMNQEKQQEKDELKCKALADLGASINLMPLSVWKKLGLPELISTRMTLELANRAICTPAGIARDVFVPVGKFTFPADFVIVDYESDPRVPLILGRPFLRTARALIDVHGEEMILRDGDERLILNMRHDTSSYSNKPKKESINMIDIYNVSHKDYLEDLFANEKATNHQSGNPTFSSHIDLTSPEVINLLSGNPTPILEPVTKSSSSPTLTSLEESELIWEEFEAYLASDSFPPGSDDNNFDPEGDLLLIEELLNDPSSPLLLSHNPLSGSTTSSHHLLEEFADELALITFPPGNNDMTLEDVIREIEYLLNHDPLAEYSPNNDLSDAIPEMFTDEHTLDYSSPPLYDDVDDDLVELKSDNDDVYDDPFNSKEDKIKESKLLIDELDPPRSSDFLPSPEYDSVFYEDFFEVDALSSTNNEDKDFYPPLYELPFHKEVPGCETLLSFSFEYEEKVFKPRILTSKGVHTSLLPELSHRDSKVFKVINIFESPMEIFPCSYGEDIRVLDVPCLHFYPP